ncbi:MAG: Asp23/Gls24 family envelope stress response protein [Puniceicoccales bacterium]|jgi:uncharacterized alkaline shock family protein YloU|nr:Asp23/Gls24 family envelope stress response protein [Puniceicoccales bacterium]
MSDQDSDKFSVPNVNDECACSMGNIRINNDVVVGIVRLSTLEVEGVVDVGEPSVKSRLAKFFLKNQSHSGIRVSEDSNGNYVIDVQVILRFGVELAKVALDIQQNVAQKVADMTMKSVSQVNVTIERIVQDDDDNKDSDQPNTDYAVN